MVLNVVRITHVDGYEDDSVMFVSWRRGRSEIEKWWIKVKRGP
jgi:hypothetical protein